MKLRLTTILMAVLASGWACGAAERGAGAGEIEAPPSAEVQFRVETVAEGLEVPWALAFAPDGRIFVTERPGRIRVIEKGQLRAEPYMTIADVEPSSESGLMDLSLHPRF